MQKEFGNEIIGSGMIWGCQYDQIMKFVNGKNYFSVTVLHHNNHSKSKTTGTGNTPKDFVANIYDLEGNMMECTLTTAYSCERTWRGGNYDYTSSASAYFTGYPSRSFVDLGSRLMLYIQ